MDSHYPTVAVLVRGSASASAASVRALHSLTSYSRWSIFLVGDDVPPAEGYNQAACRRDEDLLLFWEAGLAPTAPDWLERMVRAVGQPNIGAAVGAVFGEVGSPIAGLLTRRNVFERLGHFDADRKPERAYLEDYLVRLLGSGAECVAVTAVEFLAGSPQIHARSA